MKFIVYLQVIFFLMGMSLAAPTKQTTGLSSVQVKRVTTEPTCQQEMSGGANKVVVLANFFLPAVANDRWVLHGLWADDSKFQYVKSKARAYTTSVFNSMSPAVINKLAEFWMPTMNDPTQAPSLTDKKEHWFHEVNKHLNDFSSLDTSCYTKTGGGETPATKKTKRSFMKGLLKGSGSKSSGSKSGGSNKNTNNKVTTAKPVTTKAATTHHTVATTQRAVASSQAVKAGTVSSQAKSVHASSASAIASAPACAYKPSSSSKSGSKLVARGKEAQDAASCSSSSDTAAANQDTDPVYVKSLQEYLSAIVSFFPSANEPAYNVYEILKEAEITPGKWYTKDKIKKAFVSSLGFDTASLVCREHSNGRNSLLREIDLFLSITGRITSTSRHLSPVNIPKAYKPAAAAVCADTCVCYPTLVKKGSKTVEACTELDTGCSGNTYPTAV